MIQYHPAKIKSGQFFSDKKKFADRVSHLPDGDYIHMLIKVTNKTTREFQNYYFVFIGQWALDYGWTKSDLHDYIKANLFTELFDEEKSTTEMSQEEWTIVFLNLENFLIGLFDTKKHLNF